MGGGEVSRRAGATGRFGYSLGNDNWDVQRIDAEEASWVQTHGTWTFVDGVISQTDPTARAGLAQLLPMLFPFVLDAEVRIPSGQDAETIAKAAVVVGCPTFVDNGAQDNPIEVGGGEGFELSVLDAGDGSEVVHNDWCDGHQPTHWSIGIEQDEWHSVRAIGNDFRRLHYVDGVYLYTTESPTGGNDASGNTNSSDQLLLVAKGLADFRNIVVRSLALPV